MKKENESVDSVREGTVSNTIHTLKKIQLIENDLFFESRSRNRMLMERKSFERRNPTTPTTTKTTKSPRTHHHSPPTITSPQSKIHNVIAHKNKESEEVHSTERRTSHDDEILTPSDERKEKVNFGAKQQAQLKKIGKIITFSSVGILYKLNTLCFITHRSSLSHTHTHTHTLSLSLFCFYVDQRILKMEFL
jgi:hypothetical protein